MNQHPTLHGWLKCCCGFSKIERPMITLEQYLNGRNIIYKSEYSDEIEKNAMTLLEKVNALLFDLGIKEVKVSSGWRPPSVNKSISNAAKTSAHMTGMAVDLHDVDGSIHKQIEARPDLLIKYALWLESRDNTPSWSHLDFKTRPDRPIRIFKA